MQRSFQDELRVVANAWDGDEEALQSLAQSDVDGSIANRHRAGSALCRAAEAAGIEPSESWRRRRRATAGKQMLLEESLRQVATVMAGASVPWAPIKGLDLLTRNPPVYPKPEDRPSSDLDILVPEDRLEDARRALLDFGSRDLTSGPLGERYLREEGYAWQAVLPSSVLVEVHFRLWGQVDPDWPAALLTAAVADDEMRGALRLLPSDAFLLAATHAFTVATPRGAGIWRDLTALARAHPDLTSSVVENAERFGLQLPVARAASLAAELWGTSVCAEIGRHLEGSLRAPEKRLLRKSVAELPLSDLTLARHLAGRRCRHGIVRAAWRRLWPHPGVIEGSTPEGWWLLRRLQFHLPRRRPRE
ncbi:MAG: nucleotidyltransferase family protein [Thermoanaerobaculia bacterium]|nr:nucleotidyltransferase family protein [Thermoanaerobaculia bacterium]